MAHLNNVNMDTRSAAYAKTLPSTYAAVKKYDAPVFGQYAKVNSNLAQLPLLGQASAFEPPVSTSVTAATISEPKLYKSLEPNAVPEEVTFSPDAISIDKENPYRAKERHIERNIDGTNIFYVNGSLIEQKDNYKGKYNISTGTTTTVYSDNTEKAKKALNLFEVESK
jgi:hypothetical protein